MSDSFPLASAANAPIEPGLTVVNYQHTGNFVDVLTQLGVTLLVSTYQADKLVVIGTHQGKVSISFHNFERAMGIAVQRGRIAVGTKHLIWFLRRESELGPRVQPVGRHDSCFLARTAHVTGDIQGHELAWAGDELWVVNTLFSCLCTVHPEYSFVPRWRPPFITALAAEDRCHLNGLALEAGQPRYVTALAESDVPAGWRPTKASSGCLIDVRTSEIVARGFAMPHSPRLYDGRLWVLNSGHGHLTAVDPGSGRAEPVASLLGYSRGLDFFGPLAFVGLSKIRETSVFGGLPIAEKREQLKCGVALIDWRTGRTVAALDFNSGVDEIFAVQVLPGVLCPAVSGPNAEKDGGERIWLAPGLPSESK